MQQPKGGCRLTTYVEHNGCEIALKPYSFCNLSELNGAGITDKESLMQTAKAGAFLGTLQAGYTDFHYLRPVWKETTEEDALIGVGITGIGFNKIDQSWLSEAGNLVKDENERVAKLIGVNPAARTTTVKPSGTSSLVLGSSSGVHAAHNDYYIRRMRFGKDEAIYNYLRGIIPDLCEDEKFRPDSMAVVSIPQRAPQGAILRTEPPLSLLERVRAYNELWVKEGHVNGDNRNNVSCTISLKDNEWGEVGNWMWENRGSYNGISVLPYDGGTYVQAPFEDTTRDEYERLVRLVRDIDLTKVVEYENNTNLQGEIACGADGCQVI